MQYNNKSLAHCPTYSNYSIVLTECNFERVCVNQPDDDDNNNNDVLILKYQMYFDICCAALVYKLDKQVS